MIRQATVADAEVLSELGTATFVEAFGHLYGREDLETFLAHAHSTQRYLTLLGNPRTSTWIASDQSGRAIAYGVAGRCGLPVPQLDPNAGEIKRLYVRADGQSRKLGTQLMQVMLDWLTACGCHPLYVGVWSRNYGAQRFYERFGFQKASEYDFAVGRTLDREFILKRA